MQNNYEYNDRHLLGHNTRIILILMIISSPLLLLQVFGKQLFLIFQILFVVIMLAKRRKLCFIKYPIINLIFFSLFISAFSAYISDMPDHYKKTAIDLVIMLLPMYFVIAYLNHYLNDNGSAYDIIIKSLKVALVIQLIWIPIQLFFYHIFRIDINKKIFVEWLHIVDNASFVRSWVWYPSGLNWHSALLAPLFVLGFLIYDNQFVRIAIVVEAALCGNTTTLIGCILCFILLFFKKIYKGPLKQTRSKIIIISIISCVIFIVLMSTNIGNKAVKAISYIWERFYGSSEDASTSAHLGYYSDYFKTVKQSSVFQIIFGYGYGCSGYTQGRLNGLYVGNFTWAIESDYIDILVSRGIFGFILYYYFLFYIAIKGSKLDIRYGFFMFIILLQGFGYNIQFDYLFFMELILYISIKKKNNFFYTADKMKKNRRKQYV